MNKYNQTKVLIKRTDENQPIKFKKLDYLIFNFNDYS